MKQGFQSPLFALWFTTWLILFLALLSSCTNTQVEATVPTVTIELREIVDKSTQLPIPENTITLRWETSEGEVLDTQEYK